MISVASFLDQPSFMKGDGQTHNLRTGIDYSINAKTSFGLTLSGVTLKRKTTGNNTAKWMSANGTVDSLITTRTDNNTAWDNAGAALSFKHKFTSTKELTADVDIIGYRIRSDQYFENNSVLPGNYSEAFNADIPTDIRIMTARADYAEETKSGSWRGDGRHLRSLPIIFQLTSFAMESFGETIWGSPIISYTKKQYTPCTALHKQNWISCLCRPGFVTR
jgi:hypothetical protein